MSPSLEDRVEAAAAEYLQAADRGQAPPREEFLARHAELAADLAEFLDDLQQFGVLSTPRELPTPEPSINATRTFNGAASTTSSTATLQRTIPDYEIIEEIARGGMGIVYKARQVSLNRLVALKVIRAGEFADAGEIKRFRTEAESAANFDHPHIVPIYEVGDHAGQQYYTMRLIEGGSLSERMAEFAVSESKTRSDTRKRHVVAATLIATIARAVHHAHQRSTLHRDLKPANILLDPDGTPHVTDFGLARRIGKDSTLTKTGAIVGTPSYMAPEQARGREDVTTEADVYGLGAVLYHLLTGRPPFQGEDVLDTIYQVREREPARPRSVCKEVDRDLETVCLKCLAKDPAKRYQSAAALAEDLDRWSNGESILARRASPAERAVKWARRNPAGAGLVGLGGLAAAAIIWVLVALSYNARLEGLNVELTDTNGKLDDALVRVTSEKEEVDRQRNRATEEERRARSYLYFAHMALAQKAEKENQPGRVVQLLRSVIPKNPDEDMRGWEWHHLWRKYHGEQSRLSGHTGAVTSVAFSPDDKFLASGSLDKTIKIWSTLNGKELFTLMGHSAGVTSVAFSPNGMKLISGSEDRTVRHWDVTTGREVESFTGHEAGVTSVAYCPDGVHVASGSHDKSVRVLNVITKKVFVYGGHSLPVAGIAFSPNGKHLASVDAKNLSVWDAETGSLVKSFLTSGEADLKPKNKSNTGLAGPAKGYPVCLAFSPKGNRVAASVNLIHESSEARPWVQTTLWDIPFEKVVFSIKQVGARVGHLAFSPDGTHMVQCGLDRTARILDSDSGRELRVMNADSAVRSANWSPTGHRLAAGTDDGTIMLWANPQPVARKLPNSSQCIHVAFSRDGTRLAGCAGQTGVWDVRSGKELNGLPGKSGYNRIAWSPLDDHVVGTGTYEIIDAITGKVVRTLYIEPAKPKSQLLGGAFSRDGKKVAIASGDKWAGVWEASTGKLLRSFEFPESYVSSVTFHPDGNRLAVSRGHGIKQPRGTVKVWNIETGTEELSLEAGIEDGVWSIDYSPDGKLLAGACSWEHSPNGPNAVAGDVWVWNAETGAVVHRFRGHPIGAWSVVFSPDGRRLASAGGSRSSRSLQGEVKIWDLKTSQEVWTLQEEDMGAAFSVAFSPDGRYIATAGGRGVRIWDGTPIAETPTYQPLPDEK